jgi:uncharacterized membrane protein YdbT with pleckstrin-like domain
VETPVVEAHRHAIVLARPLFRALVLAGAGAACFFAPWTAADAAGVALLALAAVAAVLGVARWERTHLVVGRGALFVEHGLLHRRSASVALAPGTVVEIERPLLGRILGYDTVVAGELEIDCVPRRVARVLQQPK